MLIFTKELIDEIARKLSAKGMKDTDLLSARTPLDGDEMLAIVQDNVNRSLTLSDLIDYYETDVIDNKIKDYLGQGNLRMEITSSDGNIIIDDLFDSELQAKVLVFFKDVTDKVEKWTWTRYTGDTADDVSNDAIWNDNHKTINSSSIMVTGEDISNKITTFTCTALIDNHHVIATKTF